MTSGSSGSGNGTVSYTVAAHASTSSRTGTMTIAGQTFTVNQIVDTTAPTVDLTSPLAGTTVSGTITLAANASDDIGVANVEFYRDGAVLIASDTTIPYSVSFDTTTLANGNHTFYCKAYDAAGNSATSASISVTVSNTSSGTFSNSSFIAVPRSATSGAANPYPSPIAVSGLSGNITKVTVTLSGIDHANPDDLDILLVGPSGLSAILMSDAGGIYSLNNVTLSFDDNAPATLPDSTQISTGTYNPSNFPSVEPETFPAPAPGGPYGASLSVFNGATPNGTWKLFVVDDKSGNKGDISQGWRLTINTGP